MFQVFQRRYDGSVDFNQYWENYKHGFGSINGEFWLGNEKLYYLTNQRNYTLRVDMTSKFGNTYYVEYSLFRISDEGAKYPVTELGNAYGTAGLLKHLTLVCLKSKLYSRYGRIHNTQHRISQDIFHSIQM